MPDTRWLTLLCLIAADLAMRACVAFYYRDHARVLRLLRLTPQVPGRNEHYYRRLDVALAPLPFLWTWIEIVAGVLAGGLWQTTVGWIAVVLWSGGRLRALQEFGHNAVHFALCRSRPWQWWLSDLFYQFPAFKRDMQSRHQTHTLEHHRHPNHPTLDPNRARVAAAGYTVGLSRAAFYWQLFYPLTPTGAWTNVATMARNSLLNRSCWSASARCVCLLVTAGLLYWAGGWRGVACGWLVPLLISYPLFAWLSLLTEHRWFIDGAPRERLELEYRMGRPTDYVGLTGWLVRVFIAPTSDAWHLAHSLYPGVRWNYLPAIDRHLKAHEPRYASHASEGLLFRRGNAPAALSELYERLVTAQQGDRLQSQEDRYERTTS